VKLKTLTPSWVRGVIPKRPSSSQKGKNGHVLLVAGSRGMTGAAILSGLGALRVGAGLLTVGIVEKERPIVAERLPETMTLALPQTRQGALAAGAWPVLSQFLKKRPITTVAVGPGLSQNGAVRHVALSILTKCHMPIVLDADGLNVLKPKDIPRSARLIITPHPGEMARFLGLAGKIDDNDRVSVTRKTARSLGIVCVLKGHKTVISDGRRTMINHTGNSAMSTGGMGDVLTGIIAGLLAQGLNLFDAACAGVYLHGLAGDLARVSDRGLLASELAGAIPKALKKIGVK